MPPSKKNTLPLPPSLQKCIHAVAVLAAADFRKRGGKCDTGMVERDLESMYRLMKRQGREPRYIAVLGEVYDLKTKRKCKAIATGITL